MHFFLLFTFFSKILHFFNREKKKKKAFNTLFLKLLDSYRQKSFIIFINFFLFLFLIKQKKIVKKIERFSLENAKYLTTLKIAFSFQNMEGKIHLKE
ncbi:MAG: hypothetical protein DLD55_06270 [candidate division SR1 bacterium]|nr:MAG: hypothetical protein DLD55_06270 [candidate division SR1 bacterium]